MNENEIKELCRQIKEQLAEDLRFNLWGFTNAREDDMRASVNKVQKKWVEKAKALKQDMEDLEKLLDS